MVVLSQEVEVKHYLRKTGLVQRGTGNVSGMIRMSLYFGPHLSYDRANSELLRLEIHSNALQ